MMKVHWLTQKWHQVPDSIDWLHPDERKHYSQFRFEKKQHDWLLGRWTAKQILIQYFHDSDREIRMDDLAILPATDGAPQIFLRGNLQDEVISLSHSTGVGLCAISPPGYKLGCDLEKIEPRSPAFIQDYFTNREIAIINESEGSQIPLLANLIWSAKESVLKAIRTGLSIDTRQVNIDCAPGEDQGIWNEFKIELPNFEHTLYGRWQLKSGFVITMVCDNRDFILKV